MKNIRRRRRKKRLALHFFQTRRFSAAKTHLSRTADFPGEIFAVKRFQKGTTDNLVEKKTGVLSAIFKKPKDTLEYEKNRARFPFRTAEDTSLKQPLS
ncbi:MAG: hypothetical protein L6V85_02870 [Clostridiales bacterium]|nr:MAG: hypothetical protein L6V85_02870 [Clostridiales bacterium]